MSFNLISTSTNITNITNITTVVNPNPVGIVIAIGSLIFSVFRHLEYKRNRYLDSINLEYDNPNYIENYDDPNYDSLKKYLTHEYVLGEDGSLILKRKSKY